MAVNGGTLGGTGTIAGAVTIASLAKLDPGSGGVGTLTIGNSLTLNSGSLFDFELGSVAASDKVSMASSTLTLNGQQFSDFTFTPGGLRHGHLCAYRRRQHQRFIGGNVSGTIDGLLGTLDIDTVNNDLVLVIPEPSTLALLATGLIGLLGLGMAEAKVATTPLSLWERGQVEGG